MTSTEAAGIGAMRSIDTAEAMYASSCARGGGTIFQDATGATFTAATVVTAPVAVQ